MSSDKRLIDKAVQELIAIAFKTAHQGLPFDYVDVNIMLKTNGSINSCSQH